jgi:ferredoxin
VRLAILYFSGTGNTDFVARYLARKIRGPGLEVALWSVEREGPERLPEFDVLAVGFPVYEVDSPRFLREYLGRLALGDGRGAYAFCTKGAVAGNALRRNLRRLVARGYVPLGGASVGMPGSDGLCFAGKGSWMARAAVSKDYDHLPSADRLADRMRAEVAGMEAGTPVGAYRRALPVSATGLLFDWLWSATYAVFAGYLKSRFWADVSCTSCGLCERLCPVGAVQMIDGRPMFGADCVLCMRCIHACPAEAIQLGRSTVGRFRWSGPNGDFRPLALRPSSDRAGADA